MMVRLLFRRLPDVVRGEQAEKFVFPNDAFHGRRVPDFARGFAGNQAAPLMR